MPLDIEDSAFPAPVLVTLSTLVGGEVFRYQGAYYQKATATATVTHNLQSGDPLSLVAGTLVEKVGAELVIFAPVITPPPVSP